MNPPTSSPRQTDGRTVVARSGGFTPGGNVPFHTHPSTALSSPVGDAQLPERLRSTGVPIVDNADSQLESGWWSALLLTANMPASGNWVCQTIRSSVSEYLHVVQIAHEIGGDQRVYRRQFDVIAWSAWQRIDPATASSDSAQAVQSGDVTPNGTANSTLTDVTLTVTSPGTGAVYMVEIDADVTFTGAQTNIVELLVDGVAQTAQLITSGASGTRIAAHKKWRITGLAAGSRTFTARTRNSGAGTAATVKATHTLMTVERVSL